MFATISHVAGIVIVDGVVLAVVVSSVVVSAVTVVAVDVVFSCIAVFWYLQYNCFRCCFCH